eukprot:5014758-Pyramimonas_sp.AAC.1
MKPSPGRAHMRAPAVEWWWTLDTLLTRLPTLRRHNSDHQQQLTTVATIERMMEQGESQPKDVIFWKRMDTADVEAWFAAVHSSKSDAAEPHELRSVVERTHVL